MPASGSGVSVGEVRTSLGEIDAQYIPDDTIEQAIGFAEIEVENELESASNSVSGERRHMAVIAIARRIAFMSIPAESRIQAVDATVQYDLDSFIEDLRSREQSARSMLTGSNKPSFRSAKSR